MRNNRNSRICIKLKKISILFFSLLIFGCSSDEGATQSATELYQEGQGAMKDNNCIAALRSFEALDSKYPFSPYKDQVQLDLMFCYYKSNNIQMALVTADRFLRLNPTHQELDYVLYMRGLTNYLAKEDTFQALFGVDRADRDIKFAESAFKDFQQLIVQYPNSEYVKDSQLRLVSLKDYLARHHLTIAKYYYSRDAFVAAANRGQFILETYPETDSIQDALLVMYLSYQNLKQPKLAEHVKEVYELNCGTVPKSMNWFALKSK